MEKRYVDITEKESNYGKIYKVAGPRKKQAISFRLHCILTSRRRWGYGWS